MSDMAIGGGIKNADWTSALTGLAQSIGCGDVKLSGSMDNGKVTLTMTDNKTGAISSRTFTPELDPAQFADDFDATLTQTEAIKKIAQFKAEFSSEETDELIDTAIAAGESGLVTEESTGYSKALFDIYSIIRLCKTTAQELKDTMRDAREADLQASLAQTHAEAEAQRDAAQKGFFVTITCAAVMTGVTSVMGGLGIMKSGNAAKMRTGGQAGRATKKLDTMLQGGNEKLADANKTRKYKKLKAPEKQEMDELFSESPTTSTPNSAKTKEMEGMTEMENKAPKETDEQRLERFEGNQKTLEKNTDEAWGELQQAQAGGDKKMIAEKQANYDSCLRKEQYGQSVVTNEKAKLGKSDSIAADVKAAQTDLDAIARGNNNSAEIMDTERSAQKLNVASQSTMMLGNAIGGVGGSIQALESADATEIEADVKKSDARREEDNEVFSAAQQLIDEALNLAKSVNESLAQTNQNILA